jgi:predicted ABC-class ATPase
MLCEVLISLYEYLGLTVIMGDQNSLHTALFRLDGRGYPAYKEIRGHYSFADFSLYVDYVQGDPFAAPSRFRARIPMAVAGFPETSYSNRSRSIALRDFLARVFSSACRRASNPSRGSGKSGLIRMEMPGQEILERSAIMVTDHFVEARFVVGLPARGRKILGRQAAQMLCDEIPRVVRSSLRYRNLNSDDLLQHLNTAEDADILRDRLSALGLIAFVADGAALPRRTGVDDRPLTGPRVVPFVSPESLRITLDLPHAGRVSGMGIPPGVILIVGGGYHGKSTLLSALERGIYNHVPGDGRERVVSLPSAVKIRAEDGRRVEGADIRPFINHLPTGGEAAAFRTENASGSTSQAANIVEALELRAEVLLLDEDTCATNLMIRDARMQLLVEKSGEPVTAFIDRVGQMAANGVSSILVLGGSGDYFDVADVVIRMGSYRPRDVSNEAKKIARQKPTGRRLEATGAWPSCRPRVPVATSLNPRKGKRAVNIKGRALRAVLFGTEEIDLTGVAQLVDEGQLRAIGLALNLAREEFMNGERSIPEVITCVMEAITEKGLDVLDPRILGDLTAFRAYELAAALNRLRSLRVK